MTQMPGPHVSGKSATHPSQTPLKVSAPLAPTVCSTRISSGDRVRHGHGTLHLHLVVRPIQTDPLPRLADASNVSRMLLRPSRPDFGLSDGTSHDRGLVRFGVRRVGSMFKDFKE